MTIREFCEEYNKRVGHFKDEFFKNNLHVKAYLPFLTKTTTAGRLVSITTFNQDTGDIEVRSDIQYLLFYRMIIEQYTDLEIETDGFYEEYDLLNESGLLDKIMDMIPKEEIRELKTLIDLKKSDAFANKYEPHAFISSQVNRFSQFLKSLEDSADGN